MQLQIKAVQTSQHQLHNDFQKINCSDVNRYLNPVIIYEPSIQQLLQLNFIEKSAKANYSYLNKLKIKSFNIILKQDYASQIQLLEKAFFGFKYQKLYKKVNSHQKKQFLFYLKQFNDLIKINKQKQKKSIKHYQKKTLKRIFEEQKQSLRIKKRLNIFQNHLKLRRKQQFISHLKQAHSIKQRKKQQSKQTNNIIQQIYEKKILIKYFHLLIIGKKIQMLQKYKKKKIFKFILQKLYHYNLKSLQIVVNFKKNQQMNKIRVIFDILNELRLNKRIIQWNKKKILKKYFNEWRNFYILKNNQKQIDQSNEAILKHYFQLKQPDKNLKILKTSFLQWKLWTNQQKNRKKQQNIFKSFAQIKYKQILLRKSFQSFKQNRLIQRAKRFNNKKIKIRVIDCFKQVLIKQTKKLQNYFKFVQNKNVKRYFNKIKQFNKQQKEKIHIFKLKKLWFNFTLNITEQYFQKLNKADSYYQILLKFKTILALRNNVQLNHKAGYFAHYLNIVKPFKWWHKYFLIRKFFYIRNLILKKKIFFQMKCQTIRKQKLSQQQNLKNEYNQQLAFQDNKLRSFNINSMVISKVKEFQYQKQQKQFVGQTSFFRQISSKLSKIDNSNSSHYKKTQQSDQEDEIQKKLDSLMSKIKKEKTKVQIKNNTKSKQEIIKNNNNRGTQKLRIPTWSTPGEDYKVSIFQEEDFQIK